MESNFASLLSNMNLDELRNAHTVKIINGAPDYCQSLIGMLYNIVLRNKSLAKESVLGKPVHEYFMDIARIYLKNDHYDWDCDNQKDIANESDVECEDENGEIIPNECSISLDDFILTVWLKMDENSLDYYTSNDSYILYGITGLMLRKLLKWSTSSE